VSSVDVEDENFEGSKSVGDQGYITYCLQIIDIGFKMQVKYRIISIVIILMANKFARINRLQFTAFLKILSFL